MTNWLRCPLSLFWVSHIGPLSPRIGHPKAGQSDLQNHRLELEVVFPEFPRRELRRRFWWSRLYKRHEWSAEFLRAFYVGRGTSDLLIPREQYKGLHQRAFVGTLDGPCLAIGGQDLVL